MESVVDLAELGWQIQPIRYLAHPGYDPERSDESRAQLAPLPESDDACPRRHLQEDHIPDLELQVGSALVGVTFLPTLSGLKPAPNVLWAAPFWGVGYQRPYGADEEERCSSSCQP